VGGNSIAANIATGFGEAVMSGRGALIASGLVLFAITRVQLAARIHVDRRRELPRERRMTAYLTTPQTPLPAGPDAPSTAPRAP